MHSVMADESQAKEDTIYIRKLTIKATGQRYESSEKKRRVESRNTDKKLTESIT